MEQTDHNATQSVKVLFIGSVRKGFSAEIVDGSHGIRTIVYVMSPVMSAF
jgi:hypothetical protein